MHDYFSKKYVTRINHNDASVNDESLDKKNKRADILYYCEINFSIHINDFIIVPI
jgi:hypothetical protein